MSGDADRRERVPNILFIGEGFDSSDADRNSFNRIVGVVVDGLRKNHLIDPWPMLHASTNFWSAFTPGREAGTTCRPEVYLKDPNAQNPPFFTVPEPKAPKLNDRTWGLPQLVHQIGLPVPGDADTALAAFLPRLRERYGEHVTEEAIKDSFVRWRQLAHRRPPERARLRAVLHGRRTGRAPDPAGRGPELLRHRRSTESRTTMSRRSSTGCATTGR